MNNKLRQLILAAILGLTASAAKAATILYDVANMGGNTFRYDYTVRNDALAVDIKSLTIYFDVGLYENLSGGLAPTDWDPLVVQPDPNIPDDGFYDALALAAGIAPLGSLGGFSVQFDFLGPGLPGSQAFDIVDPITFEVLASGSSTLVPILPAAWLLLSALVGLGLFARGRLGFRS